MNTAPNAPIKRAPEAFMATGLFENGLGYVIVSRFKSGGRVEAGVFLVDAYCLGVKNAFLTLLHESEFEERLLKRTSAEYPLEPISPSCARKLVEQSVAYAQSLGLAPHPDYKQACRVLGGIDTAECARSFTFGKDGKPFFIQGPNDSPQRRHQILTMLRAKCGEGNYNYMVTEQAPSDFVSD